ncbi:Glu/Leu/Phe/Val dehydrogenase family protein [Actinoplanes utahensis]|uniref:Amino acid dehydrogenase n=1 Tax=Actinoplanes utahensis TaxID=1869 RepID=A0A0A6UNQ6_ACTUT|nr:Glu/Leu/Phe/Val dehydrogenase dimerization domain-containing protein [Actinoplanes utahensis]KHD76708.1 amino acid dehydrogenase [Actinoplanes utahensis]GIF33232.1 leucine dehydrogenase [Actinoplanes utahensis]
MPFNHQHVVVERGTRSGFPIVVAVHSTALGPAIGGCRLAVYGDWRDGLDDALRLSAAMTSKAALAGLPHGGGKTVVALPSAGTFDRRAVLHDVADVVEALGGVYSTGPDVGTGPDDMAVIGERTGHVFCRPSGSGDSSPATAAGVMAALRAVVQNRFGSAELAGRSFAVLGVGRVGAHLVRLLTAAGARVLASDVDGSRRTVAEAHGATWTDPLTCRTAEVDVLVPAALGGVLTATTVPALRCAAVAGPANNQLDAPATADLLHGRGILWAPDVVVSAGGIIHAIASELHHESPSQVAARITGIGDTLAGILEAARETGVTPAAAASRLAGFLAEPPAALAPV